MCHSTIQHSLIIRYLITDFDCLIEFPCRTPQTADSEKRQTCRECRPAVIAFLNSVHSIGKSLSDINRPIYRSFVVLLINFSTTDSHLQVIYIFSNSLLTSKITSDSGNSTPTSSNQLVIAVLKVNFKSSEYLSLRNLFNML